MRFGLFGTGWWARDVHGPALARSAEVELVGVWGRDRAKREALALALGVRAYAERSALIADVDAVSIALPPDIQCEVAIEAAQSDRHLLLEKPLALDLSRADELVRLVTRRGLASVVFVTGRFQPEAETVLAHARAVGGWTGGRADIRVSVLAEDDAVLQASTWRVERGALWDAAPHALSPLVRVLGPVVEVSAVADERRSTYLTLRHESGVCSQVGTTLQTPSAAFAWSVQLFGRGGLLEVPHDLDDADRYFAGAIDQLTEQVRDGRTGHLVDVRFARHLLAVVEAAERSMSTGSLARVSPAPAAQELPSDP